MRGTFVFMARSQRSARVPHEFPRCNRQARGTGLSRRARQARRASIAMAASLVSIIATPPAHAFIKPRFPTHSFVSFIPRSFFRPQFCLNSRSVLFPLELLKFEVLQTPSSASSCFDCCRSRSCVHRTRTSSLLQTPGFLLLLKSVHLVQCVFVIGGACCRRRRRRRGDRRLLHFSTSPLFF